MQPIAGQRAIHGFDRRSAAIDRQRLQRQREDDGVAKSQSREVARVGAGRVAASRVGRPFSKDSMIPAWRSTNAISSTTATKHEPISSRARAASATNDYQMRWVVRTRKDRIPPGADERDRALFGKLRDYMIRVDDSVTCKTCGKKFDIPSQHSMVFFENGGAALG